MMRATRDRHAGFATVLALSLLVLLGAVTVAVASLFAAQANRTKSTTDGTQLRQMLTAGGQMSGAMLNDSPQAGSRQLQLPHELAEHGGAVTVTIEPRGAENQRQCSVQVVAMLQASRMRQTLVYERQPDGWKLIATQLQ